MGKYKWDSYNCNLDMILHGDGLTVNTRSEGAFAYIWSGARGIKGVTKGKWFFECRVLENTPVDMPDTKERNKNVMRVGWSEGSTNLTLGEVPGSFGFGGTGKSCTNRNFVTYGKPFNVNDTVGCYIDLDSRPGTVALSRNGEFFGKAFDIPKSMEGMAFFPHIFIKNVKCTTWFGDTPKPSWAQSKSFGYRPISEATNTIDPMHQEPKSKGDCEVVMMIGLPATGKTCWAHKYVAKSGKKFDVLGTDLLLDQMRVYNMRRKGNFEERFKRCMSMASKAFNELVNIAKTKKRNYVLDQTNVFTKARSRKIQNFHQYHKVAAVCVPTMKNYEERKAACARKNKVVPEDIVNKMINNFEIPTEGEFDDVIYTDLKEEEARRTLEKLKSQSRGGGYNRGNNRGGNRDRGYDNRNRDRDYRNNNQSHGGGYNNNYGGNRRNNNYGGGRNNYGGGYGGGRNNYQGGGRNNNGGSYGRNRY